MAKLTLNPLLMRIRGKIGNAVVRLCHTGELQFVKAPDMSRVKWSEAQKEHRQRFKEAVAYARAATKDPQIKAFYVEMAAKKNKRPFDMAVSDHFKGNNQLYKKTMSP